MTIYAEDLASKVGEMQVRLCESCSVSDIFYFACLNSFWNLLTLDVSPLFLPISSRRHCAYSWSKSEWINCIEKWLPEDERKTVLSPTRGGGVARLAGSTSVIVLMADCRIVGDSGIGWTFPNGFSVQLRSKPEATTAFTIITSSMSGQGFCSVTN